MTPASSYPLNPDLFISGGCFAIERLGDAAAIAMRSEVCGHDETHPHPARSEFGDVVVRRPEAAACAVIIDDFLIFAGYPVDACAKLPAYGPCYRHRTLSVPKCQLRGVYLRAATGPCRCRSRSL